MWEVPEKNTPYWDSWGKVLPHMWLIGTGAVYPDPDSLLRGFIPQDERDWRNDVYIGLIEQAKGIIDQGERMKLYRRADRLLVEEAVIMPVLYGQRHLLVKPWVTKYPLASHNDEWFLKDVIIEPH